MFFGPTFHAKSRKPIFGDFKGFSPDSRRLSIRFNRFSVIFKQFQSASINFNQFLSVSISLTRSKKQEFINNRKVGKQHVNIPPSQTFRKSCPQDRNVVACCSGTCSSERYLMCFGEEENPDVHKCLSPHPIWGRAQGDGPKEAKVTEPNLRFPAVFCENLRFSAASCPLQMLQFPGERVNLRKSAVFCKNLRFGFSLSP